MRKKTTPRAPLPVIGPPDDPPSLYHPTRPFLEWMRMRNYSEAEIDTYLRREEPYDCAGNAKTEGLGVAMIDAMEGSDPAAIIGLPLIELCHMLRAEGWSLP